MKSYGDGWYCWHRNRNERIQYTSKPDELEIRYRNVDGHEAIKMAFMGADGYGVVDDEDYLDDLEDNLDWLRCRSGPARRFIPAQAGTGMTRYRILNQRKYRDTERPILNKNHDYC